METHSYPFNLSSHDWASSRRILLIVALTLLNILFVPTARSQSRIAFVGPLSGPVASLGQLMIEGQQSALERLNQDGGLLSENVEALIFDDQCNPNVAAEVAGRIAAEGVSIVIGHACLPAALAALPIYRDNDLALITPTIVEAISTDVELDNLFRITPSVANFVSVTTDYVNRLDQKNIVIVRIDDGFYSSLGTFIEEGLSASDGKIFGTFDIESDQNIESNMIDEVTSEDVSLVIISAPTTMVGTIAQRMRERSDHQVILAPSFWLPSFEHDVFQGKVLLLGIPDPGVGPTEKLPSLYGQAAVEIWAAAVRKAQTFQSPQVQTELRNNSFESVLGAMEFDEQGDVKDFNYAFFRFSEDGRMIPVSTYRGRPPPPPPPPPN